MSTLFFIFKAILIFVVIVVAFLAAIWGFVVLVRILLVTIRSAWDATGEELAAFGEWLASKRKKK